MSLQHCVFSCFLIVVFAISSNEVSGLKCYECSSFIDERCGTTWKFTGNDGDIFLQECHNDTVGCKKLEYLEERTGKYAVTRSCYNSTAATITQECTEMFHGMSCYCVPKQGEKTCNGQSRVAPLYLTYLGLFMVLILGYFKY